ncbi:MAG: hypothetical protein PVJ69_19610, partial [Desulfobacteraceae bacterium]
LNLFHSLLQLFHNIKFPAQFCAFTILLCHIYFLFCKFERLYQRINSSIPSATEDLFPILHGN